MFGISRFRLYIVILIAVGLLACDKRREETIKAPVVRPVKLITVGAAGGAEVSRFPAVIGANRLSELSFQVGGKLQEFPVKEAQRLERGDLIAKLDQRDFQSAADSVRAQYQNAEKEYQRAIELSKNKLIARSTLEQKKTQRDITKAQLESAEKALADSVLHAPFRGVVAQTLVKKLQAVTAGQVVVNFMGGESLEATIDLPARFLASLPKEKPGSTHRQALIILDATPNQLIEAVYKEASLLADTASQTYAITFSFRPPENVLVLPGMNATVELRFDSEVQETRVAVPMAAVTGDGENNYVWVVDKETMTVSRRTVAIEEGVGKTLVVTAGLEVNDSIVGAGAAYLSEGMKVREWR